MLRQLSATGRLACIADATRLSASLFSEERPRYYHRTLIYCSQQLQYKSRTKHRNPTFQNMNAKEALAFALIRLLLAHEQNAARAA